MKIIFFSFVALCLTYAGVAYGSNWTTIVNKSFVDEPKCSVTDQIDQSTWTKNGSYGVIAWSKETISPNHSECSKNPYRVILLQSNYDCNNRQFQFLQYSSEDWDGNAGSAHIDNGDWISVIPNSLAEAELNFVCSAWFKK